MSVAEHDIERVAKAIHRTWVRTTIRHMLKRGEETPDEAHERRWNALPPITKAEFMDLAKAAIEAF